MYRPVYGSEVVKVAGVVHLLVELHVEGDPTELLVAPWDIHVIDWTLPYRVLTLDFPSL